MRTTEVGLVAEQVVAEELKSQCYKILDQNWKTKVCEIDIIAQKGRVIYFVEVKYRSGSAQGDGLEYIGPQKIKKLHFAARVWCQHSNYEGDYCLMAASVCRGQAGPTINNIIELV